MLFRNKADAEVKFKVGANKYKVAHGGTVNLPDNVAFVVAKRGLPLEQVDGSQARSEPSQNDVGASLDALERGIAAMGPVARAVAIERLAGIVAAYGPKAEPKAEPKAAVKAPKAEPKSE